jgi:predicted DNA-binding WGR domain protein
MTMTTRRFFAFRQEGETTHINSMGELPFETTEEQEAQRAQALEMAREKVASGYYTRIEVIVVETRYNAAVVETFRTEAEERAQ